MTCLQELDQIIEDRKRRVQLEVLLLVLLQLLCSFFSVAELSFWSMLFILLCFSLIELFCFLSLNVGGAVVHARTLNNESSNGHCKALAKLTVPSGSWAV